MRRLVTVCALAGVVLTLATAASGSTLDDIKKRGTLNCGANGQLPGFGIPDSQGNWTGLDVDLCRALAAAIFNDPNKVKFVALTAKDRFTALQSGDVDVSPATPPGRPRATPSSASTPRRSTISTARASSSARTSS